MSTVTEWRRGAQSEVLGERLTVGCRSADGITVSGRSVVPSLLIVASIGVVSCGPGGIDGVRNRQRLDSTADLLAQGYTPEVSSCVTGLLDGRSGESTRSELIATCQRASDMLAEAGKDHRSRFRSRDPPPTATTRCWTRCGTCVTVVTAPHAMRCGSGRPVGSEYEEFGVTCGNRPDVLNCSDLVLADE